jgi:4-hydroxy-3-methylbut-2-enyl diphosphate reductase
LLDEHSLDLMIVLGGYNSSNTCNLARMCAERVVTYHIASPDCLVSAQQIRHKPVQSKQETTTSPWLPTGSVQVGLTSGASTPDNLVEAVIRRLEALSTAS